MDVEEFIQRMEDNYQVSDQFKSRIRDTLYKINELDVSAETKQNLLQKAEETFSRHSNNFTHLQNVFTNINKNNEKISENLNDTKPDFNIDLD